MGIRECFVPRDGWVFASADYDQLELRTLAQVCLHHLKHSSLAEALNAGRDPHTELASSILDISYEEGCRLREAEDEAFDNARQTAKVANFGFPGGLGAKTFVKFAWKSYGVRLTLKEAGELKEQWLEKWKEMQEYFNYISSLEYCGTYVIEQPYTRRIRTAHSFTKACNGLFQGLGSDVAKRAGWYVSRACYTEPSSPLFSSRIVNFIHDEFITETVECENAHEAAVELARLMVKGANEFLPDVPAKTTPLLMRRWSKKAKPLYDERGRLVPWDVAESSVRTI